MDRRTRILHYAWRGGRRFQFGQQFDTLVEDGKVACGHRSVQWILGLHGHRVTLDDVARSVGYPDDNQRENHVGLYGYQIVEALAHWNVKYRAYEDVSTDDALFAMTHDGPVVFKCIYRWWPQWRGSQYFGHHADGKPAGYARPMAEAGKTQLTGFEDGRHYGIGASAEIDSHREHRRVWVSDSNHNSPVRPERPPYDVISEHQFNNLYQSWNMEDGVTWLAIPTIRLPNI